MSQDQAANALDRRDAANFGARRATDFRRARRHSARVRFAKKALPVLVAGGLAAMIAVPVIQQFSMQFQLPFQMGALRLNGTRLTMESPKLSGFTDDNRAYVVTASTASQDLTNPDEVDLQNIHAQMELANKGWAKLASATGTMFPKRQYITLQGGVEFETNAGYVGHLKDAAIDAKAGSVVTQNPVVLTFRDAKLVADKMTVSDRGNRALFEGNVQLDFRPSDMSNAQSPNGAAQQGAKPGAGAPASGNPAQAAPPAGGKR